MLNERHTKCIGIAAFELLSHLISEQRIAIFIIKENKIETVYMTEHKYYIKLTQSKLEKDKSSVSHSKPYAKKLVSINMQKLRSHFISRHIEVFIFQIPHVNKFDSEQFLMGVTNVKCETFEI